MATRCLLPSLLGATALWALFSPCFVPPPPAARELVHAQPRDRRGLVTEATLGLILPGAAPAFADKLDSFTEEELKALQVYTSQDKARSIVTEIEACKNVDPVPNDKGDKQSHIPRVTFNKDQLVVVTMQHVMDPGIVEGGEVEIGAHWIEYIWLEEIDTGRVLAARNFEPVDASPPFLTSRFPKDKIVVPFAFCNKHGLWQGEPFRVP